jgi:hypothetical protein
MRKELFYFGTDTNRAGHYFWKVSDDGKRLNYKGLDFDLLDVDPQDIAKDKQRKFLLPKGTVKFILTNKYTVCYIEGSCIDKRWATQSVFWVAGHISFAELKELILSTPIAVEMFEMMDFKVNWTI